MRCLSCHCLSIRVICPECSARLFSPSVTRRKVGTLEVFSLFKYKNIEPFLLTKHTPAGYRLYRYFGKQIIAPFLRSFAEGITEPVGIVAVDDHVSSGYAHTALLGCFARHAHIAYQPAVLRARNAVNYAGKSLQYRLQHPRDFQYRGPRGIEVILIDDIITTGVTLQEAQLCLMRYGVEVLFALTLADARE